MSLPVLYSFRRCPYAIRARLAIQLAAQAGGLQAVQCQLREVVLKNKPAEMLALSPKATVPILQLGNRVLDESLDIMVWALTSIDSLDEGELSHPLVRANDGPFKQILDRYKYFDRFPEHPQEYYLDQAQPFLQELESSIEDDFLVSSKLSPIDLAIFPFIRQFALVDKSRFEQLPYTQLRCWLHRLLDADLFLSVMHKYPAWNPGSKPVLFPDVPAQEN